MSLFPKKKWIIPLKVSFLYMGMSCKWLKVSSSKIFDQVEIVNFLKTLSLIFIL